MNTFKEAKSCFWIIYDRSCALGRWPTHSPSPLPVPLPSPALLASRALQQKGETSARPRGTCRRGRAPLPGAPGAPPFFPGARVGGEGTCGACALWPGSARLLAARSENRSATHLDGTSLPPPPLCPGALPSRGKKSLCPAKLEFLPRGILGRSAAAQVGRVASASTAGLVVGFLGS